MSTQQVPATYESVLGLIQQLTVQVQANAEQMRVQTEETNQKIQAAAKQIEETNVTVGSLGNKVGNMSEKLLGEGKLVEQFLELGHRVKTHCQNKKFGEEGTADSGEIDLFLENGDVAILVEMKTTLRKNDVTHHIERMEKYRRFADAEGYVKKRLIGAVAGTVIARDVIDFAHEKGLYVIVQSARAVEIMPSPEGFVAHEW